MKIFSNSSEISVQSSSGAWVYQTSPLPSVACDNTPGVPFTAKHVRVVYCPEDQRLWHFGGDYGSCWQANESGQCVTQSLDPRSNEWRIETPFVLAPGDIAPVGPDEVAVCWDSLRKGFWLTSGFQQAYSFPGYVRNRILFFSFATKKWSEPFGVQNFPYQSMRSMYDAKLDRVMHINYFGNGLGLWEYRCATGTWSVASGPGSLGVIYDQSQGQFRAGAMTHHLVDRHIYAVDSVSSPSSARVMRVNSDTRQGVIICTVPEAVMEDRDIAYLEGERRLLLWGRSAKSYLIDIDSGAIEAGSVPSPLANGSPFPPYRCNYYPPTGEVIIGWNVWEVSPAAKIYWKYKRT